MSNNNNNPLGKAPWFHVIVSTGLGSEFFPGAPGTFAGFIALVICTLFILSYYHQLSFGLHLL